MIYFGFLAAEFAARFRARASLLVRFPMFQPQPRRTLTTLGVRAAVRGTRMKMKDLWMAYARASWVARPRLYGVSGGIGGIGGFGRYGCKEAKRTGFSLVVLLSLLYAPAGHLDGVGYVLAAGCIVLCFLHRPSPFVKGVLDRLGDDFLDVGN